MSGKVLLDTNAIIYALNQKLVLPKRHYVTSIITEIELYSFSGLSHDESAMISALLKNLDIYTITQEIKHQTIALRKRYGLKLPDSLICATALAENAVLVTNDRALQKVEELEVFSLENFVRMRS